MSNTRTAKPGSPLRQERYCSSVEYEAALKANLVAKRCSVLTDASQRELVWWIQAQSHQPGGLKALAARILKDHAGQFQTRAMFDLRASGRTFNADQVRDIRADIPGGDLVFPLRGELANDMGGMPEDARFLVNDEQLGWSERRRRARASEAANQKAQANPEHYPVQDFRARCLSAAAHEDSGLVGALESLALDPALPVEDGQPWFCPRLVSIIRQEMATCAKQAADGFAQTTVSEMVREAIEYAPAIRKICLIDGQARIGKSFAAQKYCAAFPGRARFAECPPFNDDAGFFRAVAKALGVSTNLNLKAQYIRDRVEETLASGDLTLVIDEAHRLFSQKDVRFTLPVRVNWVMHMVNRGVPICLITTPQFFKAQAAVTKATYWTSEQLTGRIGHYRKLPDKLSLEELAGVARALLPEGCKKSIELLVAYADSSAKYLAGIEHAVCRARYFAQKDGRAAADFRDVQAAIKQGAIPSDSALAGTLSALEQKRRTRLEAALPSPGILAASQPQDRGALDAEPPQDSGNVAPRRAGGINFDRSSVVTADALATPRRRSLDLAEA